MKNGITIFKYASPVICLIIIWGMFRSCNGSKTKNKYIPVVIKEKSDTQYIKGKDSIVYQPKPYKVLVPKDNDSLMLAAAIKDGIISAQHDSISDLKQLLTINYYDTTVRYMFGKVRVSDTVQGNKIVKRAIRNEFQVPVVTKTVTVQAQQRNVFLFGFGAIGNQSSPLFGTEISIDLKNKRDKVYEAGALLFKGGDLYYKLKVLLPIHLSKH